MKNLKKIIKQAFFTISISTALLCSSFILAQSPVYAEVSAQDDSNIKVAIDGRYLNFDVPPKIISGRTLVPLRVIFEELGATVSWDQKSKTVTGKKQGKTIKLTINSKNAYINGKLIKIDVPAKVIDNRTLVPTRFIAESLGTDVYWEDKAKTVRIIPVKEIKFTDAKLEAEIRKVLKKATGSIMTTDVKKIKKLNLDNKGISSIEGLQYFKELTELKMAKNKIKDITYLSSLTNLYILYLEQNKISDISPLRNLNKLVTLSISNNNVRDIEPLKGLTDMNGLVLTTNQIFDISVLSNLKKLEYLYMFSNPITDISALKEPKKIKKLQIIDYEKGDNLNQQLFEKFEELDKKVKEIIANVVKPEMAEVEKELALHDYIVTHVRYDRENFIKDTLPPERHSAYGALIQKTAVCDGYARSLQILLNAVGIECTMVIGDVQFLNGSLATTRTDGTKWTHAWDIVKLNGAYYHIDPTANDPAYEVGRNDLLHKYFNLSDKQMGIEYKWDREAYPACKEDGAIFNLYITEKKNVVISDNQYFFVDSNKNITRMSFDGMDRVKLCDDKANQIVLLGEWIYYINETDNFKVYKIKTDGSSRTLFCDTKTWELEAANDSIYFIKDYKINRMNPDGSNQTVVNSDVVVPWLDIIDNTLFYKSFNYGVGGRLVKSDLTGNNKTVICSDEPVGFKPRDDGGVNFWYTHNEHVLNGWVYFINNSDQKSIYKIKVDGTERTKITTDSVKDAIDANIEILNNYIYYKNASDGDKYYRINIDGTNRQVLE